MDKKKKVWMNGGVYEKALKKARFLYF